METNFLIKDGENIYNMFGPKDDMNIVNHMVHNRFHQFEPHILNAIAINADKTKTFIDIGANIGCIAIPASKYYSDGMVVAIEPISQNFNFLVKNSIENKIKNIKFLNCGISDKNKIENFFYKKNSIGTCIIENNYELQSDVEKVLCPCFNMDSIISDDFAEKTDIIKMDIEGFEFNSLKNCNLFKNNKNIKLIIELNDIQLRKFNSSAIDLFDLLKNNFKNIYEIKNNNFIKVKKYEELSEEVLKLKHHTDLLCINS